MKPLKIIPYYTGKKTLKSAVEDSKSKDMLWLEILVNDDINWEKEQKQNDQIRESYDKACLWYGKFRTMIDHYIKRKPLKIRDGIIDKREYRKFIEVLNFVSA